MSKLLPCPFCWGKVERMGHAGGIEFFCGNHDCIVQPCTHSTNERDALAAWNSRPTPTPCDELETVAFAEQFPSGEIEVVQVHKGRHCTIPLVTRQNAEEVIAAKDTEIAELKKLISSTHKNAVKHTECDTVNCLICDGGLFVCADCGAVEIETEQKICTGSMAALEAENAAKDARIAELENAIKVKGGNEHYPTQDAYDLACKAIEKHRDRAAALEADNKRLREALEFYKDSFSYHPKRTKTGIDMSVWKPTEKLLDDCGETARATLEEVKP